MVICCAVLCYVNFDLFGRWKLLFFHYMSSIVLLGSREKLLFHNPGSKRNIKT